ncbi:hypothetical protein ACGFYQ_41940 [Streptomyces sp. NPDC048258]|uniref:hypothetical protein n=1 Tax=Streptomyces sp. NPDC048258 TaxID=3365527 RepID=UPI003721B053
MTTDRPPTIDQAVEAVLEALDNLDSARNLLGIALRTEQAKTGASANDLAKRAKPAMPRPLVLRALSQQR